MPRDLPRPSRREFLASGAAAAGGALLAAAPARSAEPAPAAPHAGAALPLVDYHVHLDHSTIDKVLELSPQRGGVKFGIVEHAGTKENVYPVVLSNDKELESYLAMLAGKPVYRGVQAEYNDWWGGFSPRMLARLDYVLTDAMTYPGKDGRRVKLWEPDVESRVEMSDHQAFMDRYVDWHVQIFRQQPVDILANVSWLPKPLVEEYDALWTPARVRRLAEEAAKQRVAIEISSSYRLPKPAFLHVAKAAGVKFSFGSNGRYPNMGKLEYSLEMARELGLTASDLFTPAPAGQKAVERKLRG